jgi:hypothetical protein
MSEIAGTRRSARVNRVQLDARGRSLLGVGIGVVALLLLNVLVRQAGVGASDEFVGSPALPVVQMTRPSAWRCPGPLPVGAGKESSRVAIVNSAAYPVTVTVTVARARISVSAISPTSSVTALRRKVLGHSQAVVELSRRGPAGFAAVSVESDRGGIGVSEAIEGAANATGKVLPSSPCTLGAAPDGYLPTGSTAGSSSVTLSLFDPEATPAVVNVSVSNGSSISSPPAFQGLVVPASGLVVLDLRRWVFQVSSLAVEATAVSGSVVVGALEATSELVEVASASPGSHRVTHANLVGTSLLVGPNKALRQWAFTALQSKIGVASTFSVYNPDNTPVSVSVAPPGAAGKVAALTEEVPAGGIVDFATPITPGTRLGAKSVVISARGGAVVVARLTTRQKSRTLEELNSTAGTAGPKQKWLLPGAMDNRGVDDVVTLANPGGRTVSVRLLGLTYGPAEELMIETVDVLAGTSRSVDLGALLDPAPGGFALQVSSTAPILVEQQLEARHGQTSAVGGIPVEP